MKASSLPGGREFWRAFAFALIPRAAELDGAGLAFMYAIIDRSIEERPVSLRLSLLIFIYLVSFCSIFLGGRFSTLPVHRRRRLLRFFEDSRWPLLRSGFWGLRALVFMGYYGQPAVAKRLRWAPLADGNSLLHA